MWGGPARQAQGAPGEEPGYFALSRDPLVALVLVLPLLVFYQAGIVLLDFRIINGADFLTRLVYPRWGLKGLVVMNLSFIALMLAAIIRLENRRRFRLSLFVPLLAESALYAACLGSVIVFVLDRIDVLAVLPQLGGERLTALVLSVGAGVNEELVFRLILLELLVFLFADFIGLRAGAALALAVVLSSLAFAGAHYVGTLGDLFRLDTFLFRFLAGLIFCGIYKLRSFAVAAWTHALYDIYVLVL
ncbi:MAG: CAAX amino protease [Planctomycetota bacterium]|nr:MAG: CAAX amino protease [Planctomycetota bacterium]